MTLEVVFEPSGQRGTGRVGETVREVANRIGVSLRQVCGGQANCTTCRVRLLEGRLAPPASRETGRLPEERLEQGYRLACQARLEGAGPVRLHIPTLMEWIGG